MEYVVDYDYEILYNPDKENVITDTLSRIHISVLSCGRREVYFEKPEIVRELFPEISEQYDQGNGETMQTTKCTQIRRLRGSWFLSGGRLMKK